MIESFSLRRPTGNMPILRVVAGILAIGVASRLVALPAAQSPQSSPGRASVSGQVVDGVTGAAVRGAVVMLVQLKTPAYANSEESDGVLTGADGRFDIRGVEAGRYNLRALANGARGAFGQSRLDDAVRALTIVDGQRVANLKVPVWRGAEISGVVYDEHGEPVPHVEVRAVRQAHALDPELSFDPGPENVMTDDRGQYTFSNIPPDRYLIVVPSPIESHPPRWDGPMAPQAPTEISSGLPKRVASARGPARAFLNTFAPGTTVMADADVVNVGSGDTRVGVDVRMRVTDAGRVFGRILTPLGEAVGFLVYLMPVDQDDPLGFNRDTFTSNGGFAFERVPVGQYTLAIERVHNGDDMLNADPLGFHARIPLDVTIDGPPELAVTLTPGVRFAGRIEFDEAPKPDEKSFIVLLPSNLSGAVRVIDIPGDAREFELSAVPLGSYTFEADSSGSRVLERVTMGGHEIFGNVIEVSGPVGDLVLRFTKRPAVIGGRVESLPRDGTGAVVVAFATDSRFWEDPRSTRVQEADVATDGSYSLAPLPPGEYFIAAVEHGWPGDLTRAKIFQLISLKATRVSVVAGERRTLNVRFVRR